MEERTILRRISRGSQRALEAVMRQYSAYVVTVIHNRSRSCLSAEDEEEIASDVFLSLWQHAQKVRAALETLKPEDQEIFCRYYDLCQTATQIAAAMHMQPSTVRTRLSRGRAALRDILCQGGFQYEQAD